MPLPKIAIVTVSDRASAGTYQDLSGPAIFDWLKEAVLPPFEMVCRLIPDGADSVAATLQALCEVERCDLILVTGGTGPAPRDQTPEGVSLIAERYLPGFGETMRRANLAEVPTAILSRQEAVTRGASLIITLPGKPAAIATSLNAIFAAVPYCLDLIGAARIDTNPDVVAAFRPKGA
ncbi:molybdopterin adenylyltransferase [Pannonibacter indicus]|uniref:molybdopterin adenylyltransferase n=1 Tax=Pannonibacter indicus TaxID=466044 RepID=UPI00391A068A